MNFFAKERYISMMRVFILGIVMLVCGFSFAQKTSISLRATVGDDDNGKPLNGATIEVYKNGVLVASESSASNGKVEPILLPVCEDCKYTVKIKKSGYVTKTAIVDGSYDYPEELPPGTVEQRFDVSIFQSVPDIDFSFLDREPMVQFVIYSYGMMTFDKQEIDVMQKKIDDLKKKMAVKKEELAKEEAEKAKREADFNAYIAAGDAAMKQQDFDKAIGQYELGLGLRPGDKPTEDKITDAKIKRDELLAKAQLDKDFSAKMQAGKDAYAKGELEKALGFYKEAAGLKKDEVLPQTLIKEIEAELAKQKNNEAAFLQLVKDGDAASSKEDFDTGIAKYEAALKLKKDAVVETKLAEIKKLKLEKESALAAEKAKQVKYDQLIAKADGEFASKSYDLAKKTYEEAKALKPDEPKPTAQIIEIDKILNAQAADQAAKAKLEADYTKLIEDGKEKINQRSYPEAKAKFDEALKLKPGDPVALAQLELIKKELDKQAAEAKVNAEYEAAMKEAKILFDQKKYIEAKAKYTEASKSKPLEAEPKAQIAAIDALLLDADKIAKADAEYKRLMQIGDEANNRKEYPTALTNYNKALESKPGDADALAKIAAINKLLDEENKLAEDQKKFDAFVATANQAYTAKDYDKAKLNYNNALGIKDDVALRKKIEDIDAILAKNRDVAETNAKYEATIKEADALRDSKKYAEALDKYNEANSLIENEYPKAQITAIKAKMASEEEAAAKEKQIADLNKEGDAAYAANDYQKALDKYTESIKLRPDPAISKRIAELNTKITQENQNTEKRTKYDQKIAEANAAYDKKTWSVAKALYEEANLILPAETYPEERIAEIAKRIAEESNAEETAKYQKIIDNGDVLFKADKLDEAKLQFEQALLVRPGDVYATEQINKITQLKKDRAAEIARLKQIEEQYAALIKDAAGAETTSNWSVAIEKYKEAALLKPSEIYPQTKIKELEGRLGAAELQKQKDAEYASFITKGDQFMASQDYEAAINSFQDALKIKNNENYPKEKIASAEELIKQRSAKDGEAAYQKLLADAQAKLDQKAYQDALNLYMKAKTERPADDLPERKINEINQILAQSGEQAKLEEKYTELMREGYFRFEKGEWAKAKENYTAAYNLFNREEPERKIKECETAMKQETSVSENRQYDKIIVKADEYLAAKNYTQAKEYYNRAIGLKPTDPYPKSKLKEIDEILNPTVVQNTNPLQSYGNPNRSTNAVDVERMLANAEEQRKFNIQQRVENQGLDAENADVDNQVDQTEYSYETREDVVDYNEEIAVSGVDADLEIEAASDEVEVMQTENTVVLDQRTTYNENDIQLQNQVVNNINLEVDERDLNADVPRDAYLYDVEEMQLEIVSETVASDQDQTDVTYGEKTYVENYLTVRLEDDVRLDVDRKNTEVRIEYKNVQLINEENANTWDQEDEVMVIKVETESALDVRTAAVLVQDAPRENGELILENSTVELVSLESGRVDDQYDVNVDLRKYTENQLTEAELAAVGDDVPRMEMEVFSEDQGVENNEVNSELVLDQTNLVLVADVLIENQEVELVGIQTEADINREGYEETVELIVEASDEFMDDETANHEDNSHTSVNYLEQDAKSRNDQDKIAEVEADELIDDTKVLVENLDNLKDDGVEEANEKLTVSEDYSEGIREIDLTKIDQEMKNALGAQFPEGVTEEIYTVDDEDGLMMAYVVRRVVVKDGAGNVYEMVQTKYGTTSYTCNGAGITEFDWQDQTEAADLVRN